MTALLNPPASQPGSDTQPRTAGGSQLDADQLIRDTQLWPVGIDQSPASHHARDTQAAVAGGPKLDADQPTGDTHTSCVGIGSDRPAADRHLAIPMAAPPLLVDPFLAILAESVDDLEGLRKATANRLRHLTREGVDKDGEVRGLGMQPDDPGVVEQQLLLDGIAQLEADAIKSLQKAMRRHPLGPWVKQQKGLGEKQAARLLASIGDPYWNFLHGRPRTVSELWAYCGLHTLPAGQAICGTHAASAGGDQSPGGGSTDQTLGDAHETIIRVAPARSRGQKSNWNETARMRVWLVAQSCIKQPAGTPYRDVYAAGRVKYAEALHPVECRRCGPKGKPAAAGSPLSDGHKHARATRLIMKAVLRDLWVEARRLHTISPPATSQTTPRDVPLAGQDNPTANDRTISKARIAVGVRQPNRPGTARIPSLPPPVGVKTVHRPTPRRYPEDYRPVDQT